MIILFDAAPVMEDIETYIKETIGFETAADALRYSNKGEKAYKITINIEEVTNDTLYN